VKRRLCAALAAALPLAFAAPALGQSPGPSPGRSPAVPADPCAAFRLREVAAESGVAFRHDPGRSEGRHLPETMGSGVAWLDYDGDGWLDLYLVQSGPFPPDGSAGAANRLYRNLGEGGNGRFEDVTERSGAGDRGYGQGVAAADADGDGDTDLYVANFGPDAFLRNRGDGTFERAEAGLAAGGWSSSAAFGDVDGDGDLDLYVARYVRYDPGHGLFCGDFEAGRRDYCDPSLFEGENDLYFENRGDGTFRDATAHAGFGEANGRGLGVVFTDLDGDRRPEVYVANDLTVNLLFRNRGDGTFEDVSLFSGAAVNREGKAEAGMGILVADVDGDLAPDLGVTNFDAETNTLYRNLSTPGEPQFEDVSAPSGFGPPSYNLLGFGLAAPDLDLDGDVDVYVANGHVYETPRWDTVTYAQPDLLLAGDGRGRFADCRRAVPPVEPRVSRGLAAADYDNDGDPDLAIQNLGTAPYLLRNEIDRGDRWLGVALRGRAPNPGAVGARVILTTARGRQLRQVTAGDSYQSTSDPRLLFGLAEGDEPKELEIDWPSGKTQRIATPGLGRYLVVAEP
jgi:enediyne biosynthesis protein E4